MIKAINAVKNHFELVLDDTVIIGHVINTDEEFKWKILLSKDNSWVFDQCKSKGTVVATIEGSISKLKLGQKIDIESVYEAIIKIA